MKLQKQQHIHSYMHLHCLVEYVHYYKTNMSNMINQQNCYTSFLTGSLALRWCMPGIIETALVRDVCGSYVCVCVFMCVCVCVCVCVYACACVSVCLRAGLWLSISLCGRLENCLFQAMWVMRATCQGSMLALLANMSIRCIREYLKV